MVGLIPINCEEWMILEVPLLSKKTPRIFEMTQISLALEPVDLETIVETGRPRVMTGLSVRQLHDAMPSAWPQPIVNIKGHPKALIWPTIVL